MKENKMNREYSHCGYQDDPHSIPDENDELNDLNGIGTFIPEVDGFDSTRKIDATFLMPQIDEMYSYPTQTYGDSFPRGYED